MKLFLLPIAIFLLTLAALGADSPASNQALTNSLGMKFVPVPGTSVLMCVHETRNADYAAYAAAQGRVNMEWTKEAGYGGAQHPVTKVNYEDAQSFCRWLSAKEGKTYRLPTDAEWSKAVGLTDEKGRKPSKKSRYGQDNQFPWGRHFPPMAIDGRYSSEESGGVPIWTAPVMSYRANELGIYDLGGNVWEWCDDWYNDSRESRVLRGASWTTGVRYHMSSSYRGFLPPSARKAELADLGFRCVLDTDGTKILTNSLGMEFVPVPGTSVLMCVHETRNADYAAYAAAQGRVNIEWTKEAGNGKAQHPVTMVNYEDAQSFCRWLSAKEGKTYRLPTDAEWSKAVGLTEDASPAPAQRHYDGSTVFPWGHYYPPKRRDGNFSTFEVDDGYDDTAPVMSFRPNKIGIYDLGGNVSEWCNDWYDQSREYRFLRGSSWGDGGREQLHSSSRFGDYPPDYRDEGIGFRCVFVVAGG